MEFVHLLNDYFPMETSRDLRGFARGSGFSHLQLLKLFQDIAESRMPGRSGRILESVSAVSMDD